MTYHVQLTRHASDDLAQVIADVERRHGAADQLLDRFEQLFEGLSQHPARGSYPHELLDLGIKDYRQLIMGPYRVVYRIINNQVFILLIVDGRRDAQTLLRRRLLRPEIS